MNPESSLRPARSLPDSARRLVIYTMYDRRGDVEPYVMHALTGLRPHAQRLVVVVNGSLSDSARTRLESVCDEIVVRPNTGLDIGAQRDALQQLGGGLAAFDELLLTNDTWYGPLDDFDALFARMAAQPVHFWGMTAHAAASPHPLTGSGSVAYHLQSYWIAVRREMFTTADWAAYWSGLGAVRGYQDAVLRHESRFTGHFRALGYIGVAAFDTDRYATDNASLWAPIQLIDDGCPVLKRRVLFHSPLALNSHAVVGRWVIERLLAAGYPARALWHDLARNVQPKVLNTTAALLDVLPLTDAGTYDTARPLRVVVIAHIFYEEMTDEILDRADRLPGDYDLLVTTATPQKADRIREIIAARPAAPGRVDVRIVASNDGRDQSAFLITARDVVLAGEHDVVVKLHSKKTPQDGFNIGRHFALQQFDNLLASQGYAANVLAVFQRHPEVGIVYPPAIHIGYPTLGQGWWANKPGFARLAAALGIRVPLDDSSPLAPYGSMYFARPEALAGLFAKQWRFSDFGGSDQYRDGGLAHILERMPSYAAGEAGFVTRTVLTTDYAAISQPALEFDLDQLTALVPATAEAQFDALRRVGHFGTGRARDFARMYVRSRWPNAGSRLRRLLAPVIALRRRLRR
ncbi:MULTISPECIES: rhamnan synthesis F family protein [Microbacterium]|uniref:rhamnan synthesis F family protein n=1 Tax=Microbacterium TaxID=33882 RepID=UPI0013A5A6FC|nr:MULTISPECIES: rhamnan synthesis F family protein [Microbacterium]